MDIIVIDMILQHFDMCMTIYHIIRAICLIQNALFPVKAVYSYYHSAGYICVVESHDYNYCP